MCVCVCVCVCLHWVKLNSFLSVTALRTWIPFRDTLQLLLKAHWKNEHLKTHFSLTRTYAYLTRLIFIRAKNVSNESWTKQARHWMCKRNTEMRSSSHCCCGKAINITYSEYVSVALATKHTKRMRPLIFSFVACLNLPYFSTLSHKRHDLGGVGEGGGGSDGT